MKLGFIGLGKMGTRMVLKLLEEGFSVVVWNRSEGPMEKIKNQRSNLKDANQKLITAKTIQELVENLEQQRVIWSMLPQGEATQFVLDELENFVQAGDIIIDGGNAHYTDTQRRYEYFKKRNIRYVGIGVSGGVHAYENGFALMVGGDRVAFELLQPILESLAKPNAAYLYLGEGGAGHFAKMVHNAIEYGIMQSIGEGFGILDKAPYQFNLLQVAKVYQKGSIISGFLMDMTVGALAKDERLAQTLGIIDATGEAKWAIEAAKKEKVDVEIIEKSLEFRKKSQHNKTVQNSFSAKVVAALRHEFGGHEVKIIKK